MGVNSVNGPGLAPVVLPRDVATPAPPLRPNEAASTGAPPTKAGSVPKPREEQVQRVQSGTDQGGPQLTGTRLRVDPDTKRIIAQIVNEKGEVIRQLPPEDLLRIAARARQIEGLIFDRQT